MSKVNFLHLIELFAGGDSNASVFNRTFFRQYPDVYYHIHAYGFEEFR